ncbi:MAG: site-specific DNA-methyltransferase [Calditrichaeota bacterium]|nr:site-specific DNA-methyltransferase [Calditrichota bacterium]
MSQLLSIKEASKWASVYLQKQVTTSNISYLIQYGRIVSRSDNGKTFIYQKDLEEYYESYYRTKEDRWKKDLGDDLNWALSFSEYKEAETTKHVHRLHPYKGKFIPQLVEYFIDSHTDDFKKEVYFRPGDVILDPFCGSGTALVQANELGIHAVGVDVSVFNTLISNVKIRKHNIPEIWNILKEISTGLRQFQIGKNNVEFELELLEKLRLFNLAHFPSPEFKRNVRLNQINEKEYSKQKEAEFLERYKSLVNDYKIEIHQKKNGSFLDKWFIQPVRDEINFVFEQLKKIEDIELKKVFSIILSRTIRSCRATTHADLASLKEPVTTTYYCRKHGKICKPLFSILSWWERYGKDTIKRLDQFNKVRTDTFQRCLTGDSRTINIFAELTHRNPNFGRLVERQKIKGIFSSPPYVGLIDYHEQHAYSYDLFGFERQDELEIGPLCKGQGREAQEMYSKGIAEVLMNSKKYFQADYDVLLVANDKYNLYPKIADLAGMRIVNKYKRPVLNRVEKDRSAYSEIIFHLKEK